MSKKSRLDLLVRVRYQNPIPPPPFPPKLFDLQTDINRLGEPSYLDHLASSTPLPMLVDSEMGMPLDLNVFDGVWEGRDTSLNPDQKRDLDPEDLALLAPRLVPNEEIKPTATAEVSWMRVSNLFTRKANARKREALEREEVEEVEDASEAAQIMVIDKSFADATTDVPHPKRKRLVEAYPILPDMDAWSNPYIMLKVPERPSADASISRLRKAVLRPIMEDDQQIMEYYLPLDGHVGRLEESFEEPASMEVLERLKELGDLDGGDPQLDDTYKSAHYDHVRTYEVVQQDPTAPKDVLLSFDEGQDKRRRGAYYKDINMRTALKKTRRADAESRVESWDKVRLGYRMASAQEQEAESSARAQVQDPDWISAQLRGLGDANEAEGLGEAIDDE